MWDPTSFISSIAQLHQQAIQRRNDRVRDLSELLADFLEQIPRLVEVARTVERAIDAGQPEEVSKDGLADWPPYAALQAQIESLQPAVLQARIITPSQLHDELDEVLNSIETIRSSVETVFLARVVAPDMAKDVMADFTGAIERATSYLRRLVDASVPYLRNQLGVD